MKIIKLVDYPEKKIKLTFQNTKYGTFLTIFNEKGEKEKQLIFPNTHIRSIEEMAIKVANEKD